MRILLITILMTFQLGAWADLIYVFPFRDGSVKTLSFRSSQGRVEVLVGRVPRSTARTLEQTAKLQIDQIRSEMKVEDRDPFSKLSRLLYTNFPMIKSFSVPVQNFSHQLAAVIDTSSWVAPDNRSLMDAMDSMNFRNQGDEFLLSSGQYESEGFHEADYLASLQNYLLEKYRFYSSRKKGPVNWPGDFAKAKKMLSSEFNGGSSGVFVMNDSALDFSASLYASAFLKVALLEEIYGMMASPFAFVHGDLQRNLTKKANSFFPNSNIWVEQALSSLVGEGRVCALAIDREMNVLRHLGFSLK